MLAAVYTGHQRVEVQEVPTPTIGPGELLVRVEACGICHTDLKKIEYDLLAGPRIYGHETAGVVVQAGTGVTRFAPGDAVVAFHHIPCSQCFYCQRKLYAQCAVYKRVGITAGFEPAGGGFAQYVRIMDWIVARGVEKIPAGVSFAAASLIEPLNTCLKAVVQAAPRPGDVVVVMGQGPIGLKFTMLLKNAGAYVIVTDLSAARRALALELGADEAYDPTRGRFGRSHPAAFARAGSRYGLCGRPGTRNRRTSGSSDAARGPHRPLRSDFREGTNRVGRCGHL